MPNWVTNKIEIKPKNKGKEILDKIIWVNENKEDLESEDVVFDFNNIIPMPKTSSWYEWCCKYWGTKWNSSNTYRVSDNIVEFETAWSCPFGVLEELSRQNKNVEVNVSYADEDIGFNCGEFTLYNGKVISEIDIENTTDFALDLWGYDKECED